MTLKSIVLEQAAIFPLYGQCNAEMISCRDRRGLPPVA